ncbi:MAG: WG repeat-containing protein [Roseburia sp.]
MKNYKNAVPLALVIFMGLGIYVNVNGAMEEQEQLNEYLNSAREYAQKGIIDDALDSYDAARAIDNNLAINIEEGELLASSGRTSAAIKWGENLKGEFPKEPEAYSFLLNQYIADEDYEKCFDLYDVICSMGVINDDIKKSMDEIMYTYSLQYLFYDDVGVFGTGYSAVCDGDEWGYVNESGKEVIKPQFSNAGVFTGDYAAVCDENNEWYYITTEGNKKYIVENLESCEYLGPYINEVLVAKSADGYGYYDISFECIADSFEEATTMNNGIGAVKTDDGWKLLNSQGQSVSDAYYDAVVVDEKGICYRNDRLFVRKGVQYYMLDGSGNEIKLNVELDDAYPFLEADGLAAVKVDGKWGFINKEGEMVIEPQYTQARSFLNGYAAVADREKWGFITEENNLVIPCEFNDAKDFNSKGCVFVKEDSKWRLLSLYKDNH